MSEENFVSEVTGLRRRGIFPCAVKSCQREAAVICFLTPLALDVLRAASDTDSRAPGGEYHRHICHEFWAGRWRVHRERPVERRSDRQATLQSRRPAAGHRECANHRLGAFIEAVKP